MIFASTLCFRACSHDVIVLERYLPTFCPQYFMRQSGFPVLRDRNKCDHPPSLVAILTLITDDVQVTVWKRDIQRAAVPRFTNIW